MKKSILMTTLLILLAAGCRNTGVDSFNYERDTPEWLKDKIENIATDPAMTGSVVYRYNWSNDWVYHITIPVSSCAFCELYTRNGRRIHHTEFDLSDFLQNRTDEVVVWEWE